MPVELKDIVDRFTPRSGPINGVDENGHGVTYGTSGVAQPVDPGKKIEALEEIQIVLMDEMSRPTKSILGSQLVEIKDSSPGWVIVVDDTVEPDEGQPPGRAPQRSLLPRDPTLDRRAVNTKALVIDHF